MKKSIRFIILLTCIQVLIPLLLQSQGIKGEDARRHTIRLTKDHGRSGNEKGQETRAGGQGSGTKGQTVPESVLMVGQVPLSSADSELLAAMDFLRGLNGYSPKYITFMDLKKKPNQLKDISLVWFHRFDSTEFSSDEANQTVIRMLREYLDQGGKILLTLDAFPYINLLGIEPVTPSVREKESLDEGYGRKLGFHAFRDHPLFAGLNGGAYIYKPIKDLSVRIHGFFGDTVPRQGKVVGIDWDYIFFSENSKLIVEYNVGKGKLLAIGAYTLFSAGNGNRRHLEAFTSNALNWLTGKLDSLPAYYWSYTDPAIISCPERVDNRDVLFDPLPPAATWTIPPDPDAFPPHPSTSSYCEAAGERILMMGQEKGGIEEIWTHPFMALRDLEVGIRNLSEAEVGGANPASDSIVWLTHVPCQIEIRTDGFIRHYQLEGGILDEIVVADPANPCAVVHYTWKGDRPVELHLRFSTNLRLMWPYPAEAIGSVCYGWDSDYQAFYFTDQSGDLAVMVGGNDVPLTHDASQGDGFVVNATAGYGLEPGESLDIVVASGTEGIEEAASTFDRAIRAPESLFARSRNHVKNLFSTSLMVTAPDPNFNAGYRWALLGTDRFFVTTPGMGSALVAGYATTRRGWDGAQRVSGRPGYAWYFGRDGEWSGMAVLDYGDFGKVKKNLEFYLKYQDLSGKIFHEATTSGVIHYDASDATPLFIVLAGRYLSHSGDTAFIRTNWKGIRLAIDFCYSTDTDGDHLIENTNVGHGWVEGGNLFGSHSSFYLTGCWVAALEAAAKMADAAGDNNAGSYRQEAKTVRNLIDQEFWNQHGGFYSYGINKDGSQRTDETILPTVPAYFGVTEKFRTKLLLDRYASNSFSTNWGTRIIGEESPLFKPTGYHYGSVWPLFTGWTSLAEYRYGNYLQGFTHIMNNLNIYRNWGMGYVEEVLNGSEYQPSGVCPHQCWSETMVIQPVIEGMLGIDIDAPGQTVRFSPRIPPDWNDLSVKHIRIGSQFVNVTYKKDTTSIVWKFNRTGSQPVNIRMMMALPPATKVNRVLLNGTDYPFATFTESRFISFHAEFPVDATTELRIDFSDGISVLPMISSPFPGTASEGTRIIDANLKGDRYLIDIEGLAGTTDTVSVWSYRPLSELVENAKLISRNGFITKFLVEFDAGETKYIRKKLFLQLPKSE